MMQNYSNPCIGIGAFFPSFLSFVLFFAPVAAVEIKADLAQMPSGLAGREVSADSDCTVPP